MKLNIISVQRIILIVCLSVAPSFALCKQITIKSVEKEIRLKNFSKAEGYLKKLSSAGNTKAQYMLAVLYRNGHVIQKNEKKAYGLFLDAARKKHIKSQYELALMYYSGSGTDRDIDKAIYWLKKSSNRNHKQSIDKLNSIVNNKTDSKKIFGFKYAKHLIKKPDLNELKKYKNIK
ncbi:MAG: sel1 repeat family protein, partial [Gammaproteobacteria bacterium]|nr:sel1 repeat family protein [Gammaproteobacteria bacterium]